MVDIRFLLFILQYRASERKRNRLQNIKKWLAHGSLEFSDASAMTVHTFPRPAVTSLKAASLCHVNSSLWSLGKRSAPAPGPRALKKKCSCGNLVAMVTTAIKEIVWANVASTVLATRNLWLLYKASLASTPTSTPTTTFVPVAVTAMAKHITTSIKFAVTTMTSSTHTQSPMRRQPSPQATTGMVAARTNTNTTITITITAIRSTRPPPLPL